MLLRHLFEFRLARKLATAALVGLIALIAYLWESYSGRSLAIDSAENIVMQLIESPVSATISGSEAHQQPDGQSWLVLGEVEIRDGSRVLETRRYEVQIRSNCEYDSLQDSCWTREFVRIGEEVYLERQ